ncbi:MAG: sugar-transfer associated ATP-grasp domain-containing protein [Polyangiales bacterium]
MTALRWWSSVVRFALRGALPERTDEVTVWSLCVPYALWGRVARVDGRTFAELHGARAPRRAPLRALYLAFLFLWPLVALSRALRRPWRARRYLDFAMRRPELATLYPWADLPRREVEWSRPDYALAMTHGWLYAQGRAEYCALDDKLRFLAACRAESLPLPETVSLTEAVARGGSWFVKLPNADLGYGVQRLDAEELRELPDDGSLIVQAPLRNHPSLRAVFSDAAPLSSFRVLTLRDPDTGEVRAARCAIRIGRAGAIVDNTQQGGIWAQVDARGAILSGVTKKTFGKTHRGDPLRHPTHPDTRRSFEGLAVPHYDRCVAMALDAHRRLAPEAISLGFDLALAEDEPVFLEVNVWATCYDHDPPDDLFTPSCEAIVRALREASATG